MHNKGYIDNEISFDQFMTLDDKIDFNIFNVKDKALVNKRKRNVSNNK